MRKRSLIGYLIAYAGEEGPDEQSDQGLKCPLTKSIRSRRAITCFQTAVAQISLRISTV